MKNRVLLLLLVLLGFAKTSFAQTPETDLFFVFLQEKPAPPAGWTNDFHPKAKERRERHNQQFDWYDMPLDPFAVQTIVAECDSLRYQLRWMNAVSIAATEDQIQQISDLPFVKRIEPFERGEEGAEPAETDDLEQILKDSEEKLDLLYELVRKQMQLDLLDSMGFDGSGVRIAVFDAGFKKADKHPGLAHLFENEQIKLTRDFYGGKKDVFYHSGHGTAVVSCIAGRYKDKPIGAAQNAEFLLARTEGMLREKIIEEDHWLAAMEWADQNGADIISSSLGYSKKRYTYSDMNGGKTRVTQAANLATRKGILVVNSAGNEGNGKFHYIGAPADGDSVLAVGGTYPMVPVHIRFSSFGPNYRKVMKPNVSAPGAVCVAKPNGKFKTAYGTSFAAPLVSGFAAVIMELHPESTNMEVFRTIEACGHLYPYFDYAHGFGVPRASALFEPPKEVAPTFWVDLRQDTAIFLFDTLVVNRDTAVNKSGKGFYLHFQSESGELLDYNFDLIKPGTRYYGQVLKLRERGTLRAWFEGYLFEQRIMPVGAGK